MMEDREIIELFWERDEAAIRRSAEKYGSYCSVIARNILQNREDAEECVNDAWLSAWNSIPPQRPNNLKAYFGKLTHAKAIDRWRSLHREKRGGDRLALALEELEELLPGSEDPEQHVLQGELAEALNRFLGSLPQTERNVFLCRYWYFDGIAEIAASFGFGQSKVKSMLHRTRGKLRSFLQKEELI